MKKLMLLLLGLIPSGALAEVTYYHGATVIDGNGGPAISNGVIIVEGDKLTCVGKAQDCQKPTGAKMIDVTGKFITPGLVDAHVHFGQTGWIDGRPDGMPAPDIYPYAKTAMALKAHPERWHQSYLCSGITAVFDVGGPFWTTKLRDAAENNPRAAHVKAAGPLITWAGREALNLNDEIYTFLPMGSVEEALASVKKVKDQGAQAVKVWFLAPPKDQRAAIDQRMLAVGKAVEAAGMQLLVHATSLREAKIALQAGADMLVHSVEDQAVDDEFLTLLVNNNAYYVPTLLVGRGWTRAIASVALETAAPVDDPNACVDPRTLANISNPKILGSVKSARLNSAWAFRALERTNLNISLMNANLMAVHNAGGLIATGTDAGNPMTLHGPSIYAEMEAMQKAGLTPAEIITLSTRNGAGVMGDADKFGTLENGKIADFLVLTQDPRKDISAFRSLSHIIRAGESHQQADLAYGNKGQ